MTGRRLRVLVLVGALTVAGLAGCRSEPGVAAYVGDTKITEDRVTQVYDDVRAKLDEAVRRQADEQAAAAGQPAPTALPDVKLPITRKDVLSALVARDVFKEAAREKGVSPTELTAAEVARNLRLPPSEYITIFTEYLGYRDALTANVTPSTPTEEDLHGVYERLVAAAGIEPSQSFADFQAGLQGQNLQSIAITVAARNLLAQLVSDADIVVNPRYAPVELDLLGFQDQQGARHPLVVLPLGIATSPDPVVDR